MRMSDVQQEAARKYGAPARVLGQLICKYLRKNSATSSDHEIKTQELH